jgi:hypothetical protein
MKLLIVQLPQLFQWIKVSKLLKLRYVRIEFKPVPIKHNDYISRTHHIESVTVALGVFNEMFCKRSFLLWTPLTSLFAFLSSQIIVSCRYWRQQAGSV